MIVKKWHLLTEAEFNNISGSEAYGILLENKYQIEFVSEQEAEELFQSLIKNVESVWYYRKDTRSDKAVTYVYVSCDAGIDLIEGFIPTENIG